jgi:hypothetical protein
LSAVSIISDSRAIGTADGLTFEQDLERRLGRKLTAMDGLRIIEVRNAGLPAWLMEPVELESDSITFEIARAHVFVDWCRARDTVSRLRCGYPKWECVAVEYNEVYRAQFAGEFPLDPALEGPQRDLPALANKGMKRLQ